MRQETPLEGGGVMVRRTLDLKAFAASLKKVKEQNEEDYVLPKSIERGRFERFLKLLEAKNSAELEDMSIEEVCSFFSDMDEMLSVFSDETPFHDVERLFHRIDDKKSILLQRRIL